MRELLHSRRASFTLSRRFYPKGKGREGRGGDREREGCSPGASDLDHWFPSFRSRKEKNLEETLRLKFYVFVCFLNFHNVLSYFFFESKFLNDLSLSRLSQSIQLSFPKKHSYFCIYISTICKTITKLQGQLADRFGNGSAGGAGMF